MLMMMPLPDAIAPFRPDWIALILIFWAMTVPRSYSIGIAWIVGVVLDVAQGTLLGQTCARAVRDCLYHREIPPVDARISTLAADRHSIRATRAVPVPAFLDQRRRGRLGPGRGLLGPGRYGNHHLANPVDVPVRPAIPSANRKLNWTCYPRFKDQPLRAPRVRCTGDIDERIRCSVTRTGRRPGWCSCRS